MKHRPLTIIFFIGGLLLAGCYAIKRRKEIHEEGSAKMMRLILQKVAPGVLERLNMVPELAHQMAQLRERIESLETEARQHREQLESCERELDESRSLNRRAAEILDITYAQLAMPVKKTASTEKKTSTAKKPSSENRKRGI